MLLQGNNYCKHIVKIFIVVVDSLVIYNVDNEIS